MKSSLETVMSFTGVCALGALCGYLLGKERGLTEGKVKGYELGLKVGAQDREKEILDEYVCYVPVGELEDFAKDLMETKDVTEDYPLLVVRSDKYNFLNGVEFED